VTTSQPFVEHFRRILSDSLSLSHQMLAGSYKSKFRGSGIEFEALREYQEGDDTRTIDWNVTARSLIPHIKLFREEREKTILLAVDTSSSTLFGSTGPLKLETMAEIASLIAFSAILNRDKVGLLLFSNEIQTYFPPTKGSSQGLKILRQLLINRRVDPRIGEKTNYETFLKFLLSAYKKKITCFLISDFLHPLPEPLAKIASKKHELIALRIVDPFETVTGPTPLIRAKDLETGEVQLVQGKKALTKEKMSLQTIDFVTTESPLQPLMKFFRNKKNAN